LPSWRAAVPRRGSGGDVPITGTVEDDRSPKTNGRGRPLSKDERSRTTALQDHPDKSTFDLVTIYYKAGCDSFVA